MIPCQSISEWLTPLNWKCHDVSSSVIIWSMMYTLYLFCDRYIQHHLYFMQHQCHIHTCLSVIASYAPWCIPYTCFVIFKSNTTCILCNINVKFMHISLPITFPFGFHLSSLYIACNVNIFLFTCFLNPYLSWHSSAWNVSWSKVCYCVFHCGWTVSGDPSTYIVFPVIRPFPGDLILIWKGVLFTLLRLEQSRRHITCKTAAI